MTRSLILIPSPLERQILQPFLTGAGIDSDNIALCGFGLIAAAARTAQLIAERRPNCVVLVGLAGAFDSRLFPGDACLFSEVTCHGIGAGTGAKHMSAEDMGWPQFTTTPEHADIGDTIEIPGTNSTTTHSRATRLLSVAAASGNSEDAALRRLRFPDAVAEDMEGYGIAFACRLTATPFDIVRGISNRAGDRDKAHWQIDTALIAAADLAIELLAD